MKDDLKIGDKLLIINNKLGDRTFGTINVGEVITITGFGAILLALLAVVAVVVTRLVVFFGVMILGKVMYPED